jgi:uncharacterized protein YndB with AHSA1/START domain
MRPTAHTLVDFVPVPLAQMFRFLTSPGRIPDWLPGCNAVQYEAPLQQGARIMVRFSERITEFEIVHFAPPATFSWTEHGGRQGSKTFFRLDGVHNFTALTIRAVWIPQSLPGWVRGRFLEKRKVEPQLRAVVQRLHNILTR